uniref:Uncharacterized protein n=1 Tax=Trichuris muris TaxID=70415 RepID=A0A5S6QGE9_TRIMR
MDSSSESAVAAFLRFLRCPLCRHPFRPANIITCLDLVPADEASRGLWERARFAGDCYNLRCAIRSTERHINKLQSSFNEKLRVEDANISVVQGFLDYQLPPELQAELLEEKESLTRRLRSADVAHCQARRELEQAMNEFRLVVRRASGASTSAGSSSVDVAAICQGWMDISFNAHSSYVSVNNSIASLFAMFHCLDDLRSLRSSRERILELPESAEDPHSQNEEEREEGMVLRSENHHSPPPSAGSN